MNQPWIKKYLTAVEVQALTEVVARSETTTRGEIVPVIVKSSSAVRHVPWILALFMMWILSLTNSPVLDFLYQGWYSLLWFPIFLVFLGLGFVLNHFSWVQRLFTPNADEIAAVNRRAHLEFYLNKINHTQEAVGILIFLSLMERRVVILADKGISQVLPEDTWQKLADELIAAIKAGRAFEGLKVCIESCGTLLSQHLPARAENSNELCNQLVIKE
ncbi:MAG: TPM domain-containing protein [Bdellovibrionia bacterium]